MPSTIIATQTPAPRSAPPNTPCDFDRALSISCGSFGVRSTSIQCIRLVLVSGSNGLMVNFPLSRNAPVDLAVCTQADIEPSAQTDTKTVCWSQCVASVDVVYVKQA